MEGYTCGSIIKDLFAKAECKTIFGYGGGRKIGCLYYEAFVVGGGKDGQIWGGADGIVHPLGEFPDVEEDHSFHLDDNKEIHDIGQFSDYTSSGNGETIKEHPLKENEDVGDFGTNNDYKHGHGDGK
ncbi:hypothetical protein BJX70DRAFT_380441 [Aspergillus crustosus]